MGSGLHVHTRVAHIEHLVRQRSGLLADEVHDGRIGLHGETVALTQYSGETDVGEKVANEFLCRFLVFVGGNGQHQAVLFEGFQQLRDARIGTAVAGVVRIIIRYEVRAHEADVLLRPCLGGQSIKEQVVDAPADKVVVGL